MIDRALRNEIVAEVKKSIEMSMETSHEVWLSGEELCKTFQMFNRDWLKRHGALLPRTRAEITDERGETHVTRWAYPRNRIQRMVAEGAIKRLGH